MSGTTAPIMLVSLVSGLAAGFADWLSGLTASLNPAGASLLGTLAVGCLSVGAREGFGLLRWYVERRAARAWQKAEQGVISEGRNSESNS